jgi:hypothetical protein
MAFSNIGSVLINANNKVSGTTLISGAVTSAAAVGDLVIVGCCTDNFGTTDIDDSTEHSTLVDSVGNTYTKIKETRNANAGAGNGVTLSLWYTTVTVAIVSGSTTFTLTVANAVTAKCMQAQKVTCGLGKGAYAISSAAITEKPDAADPGALSTAKSIGLSNDANPGRECLLWRVVGGEGVAAALTASTGGGATFTGNSSGTGTSGGATATNVAINAEKAIISTGDISSIVSDPTWQAVDGASIMAPFFEGKASFIADNPRRVKRNHLLRR